MTGTPSLQSPMKALPMPVAERVVPALAVKRGVDQTAEHLPYAVIIACAQRPVRITAAVGSLFVAFATRLESFLHPLSDLLPPPFPEGRHGLCGRPFLPASGPKPRRMGLSTTSSTEWGAIRRGKTIQDIEKLCRRFEHLRAATCRRLPLQSLSPQPERDLDGSFPTPDQTVYIGKLIEFIDAVRSARERS
jgi:hypothetical protein